MRMTAMADDASKARPSDPTIINNISGRSVKEQMLSNM